MERIKEPTAEQCTSNEIVFENEKIQAVAIWYPQMGGYVGKAVALIEKNQTINCCFECLVWHDGEFPFSEEDSEKSPARIHHCCAEQFIEFGKKINSLINNDL